eukprot:437356_1
MKMNPLIPISYVAGSGISIVTSLLQFMLTYDNICTGNESNAIALLAISLILFVLTLVALLYINNHWDNLFNTDNKIPMFIPMIICLLFGYLIQFGMVINIFRFHSYSCQTDNDTANITHNLFIAWIVTYSLIFIFIIGAVSYKLNKQFDDTKVTTITAAVFQFILILIPSVLQIILVATNACNQTRISLTESIVFLVLGFMICLVVIMVVIVVGKYESTFWCIMIGAIIGSIAIIGEIYLIYHSLTTWIPKDVQCNEGYDGLRIGTIVSMCVVAAEYAVMCIVICCVMCVSYG